LFGRHDLARNFPKHGRDAVFLHKEIGTITRQAGNFITKIHISGFFEDLDLFFGRDFVQHAP
jgi:hypothetical protein